MRVTVSSVPFYTVSSSETNQTEINLILYENAYIQTCVSICTVQSDRKSSKYPFIPNRLVYLTLLDRSISELKGVWFILFVIMFKKKKHPDCDANSVDTDQTVQYAVSEQNLPCLRTSLLRNTRHECLMRMLDLSLASFLHRGKPILGCVKIE